MIIEAIITTQTAAGTCHVTPMGFRWVDGRVRLAPFVPSTTLDNLRRERSAIINLTDNVRIFAGCLTGHREFNLVRTDLISGWRLADALVHYELEVDEMIADEQRPVFFCKVLARAIHGEFQGFNRAQAAIVEAAILISRLEFLSPDKVASEMKYLHTAVAKTGGENELEAWRWLTEAVAAHPRHVALQL
ncbi:MAG: DUF447 domain-containing protein [Pseudomonadota bacterium]